MQFFWWSSKNSLCVRTEELLYNLSLRVGFSSYANHRIAVALALLSGEKSRKMKAT